MKWAITKNTKVVSRQEIPQVPFAEFRDEIISQCHAGKRVIAFFGIPEQTSLLLYVVLADDEHSKLLIASSDLGKRKSYPALTPDVPAFHIFERELYENHGVTPEHHPWLKPVRYGFHRADRTQTIANYPFFTMSGDEVHEVAVGPIHAGVIEPGHFRFMCQGEIVHHLEIQLGYQHRGVEYLFLRPPRKFLPHLAESIAGDTVIGHVTAYANAMESLGNVEISPRAEAIRAIALEMERAAIHIGDMAAIANDVAYLMGNAVFGATRTLVINSLLAICGSRFGRGLVRVGGVVCDMPEQLRQQITKTLAKVYDDVELMSETMFSLTSVLSRLEQTGVVTKEQAQQMGLVGLAARASGVAIDVRADHPFGLYRYAPIYKIVLDHGDVFARTYLRYVEIQQSLNYIQEQCEHFPDDGQLLQPVTALQPDSFVVSLTEGWRGEIVHTAITGQDGALLAYKIKDPSFNNWYGLAQAVRTNEISDFPLCNKSFNLSYCGNDL